MKRLLILLFVLAVALTACSRPDPEPSEAYLRMKAAVESAYPVPGESIVDHLAALGIACTDLGDDGDEDLGGFCTLMEGDSSKHEFVDDYRIMFREDHTLYEARGKLVSASKRRAVREAFVWIVDRPECALAIFSPYDSDRWICFGDSETIDHDNVTYDDKAKYVAALTELFSR